MSSEFDQRSLVKYFVAEALEGMGVLTKALHPAGDSLPTPQQLQEQYIIAHRIRGAASLYGYDGIAKLSEQMETILEQAQPIPDADWPRAVGAMRETVQGIQTIVQAISAGEGEDRTVVERCLASLAGLIPDSAGSAISASNINAEVLLDMMSEVEECCAVIDAMIPRSYATMNDDETISGLVRTAHTLKGLAYTIGFQVVSDITERMEDCMIAVKERRMSLTRELLDVFAQVAGLVRLILRRNPGVVEQVETEVPVVISRLNELRNGQALVLQADDAPASTLLPDGEVLSIMAEQALGAESPEQTSTISGSEASAVVEPVVAALAESSSEPVLQADAVPPVPSVTQEYIAPIIDAEVLSYFVPEIEEYLDAIDGLIPILRVNMHDEDAIHRLFRAAHTLKGSAYTVGCQVIGDIGLPMEDCMVAVKERRIPLTVELLDVIAQAGGLIRLILQRDPLSIERLQTEVLAVISLLSGLRDGQAIVLPADSAPAPASSLEEPPPAIEMTPEMTPGPAEEIAVEAYQPTHLSDDYFLPQLDAEVITYFVPEAQEYLEALETNFLRLDKDTKNGELINQLFRSAHTLKGSAYTIGFQAIGDLVHHVEDFMAAVRDNDLSVLPGHTDLMLRGVDVVRVLIRRDPSVIHMTRQRFEAVLWELKQLGHTYAGDAVLTSEPVSAPVEQAGQPPELAEDQSKTGQQSGEKPGDEREVIRVSYARLEKMMNLVGELVIGRSRLEQRLHALERLSDQVSACKARLVDSIQTFSDKHMFTFQAAPAGPSESLPQGGRGFGDFGSLELDKYDDFNILARRIGEVTADITESMAQLNSSIDRAHGDMSQLQQLTLSMRDEIGRARMVPIGTPFIRFRRAVREIARASNKDVSLVTSGEHTEVDTAVVERLVDPLVHLVRNAVFHGIELPADRIAKGKPAAGTIYLHAAHRGNSIIVEIEDDGGGLDLGKIRAKAVNLGLAQPDRIQAMTDAEALQFIFTTGFSTAETVGDQAGRGVGLDVVKAAVEGMNGHIEVESVPGIGTKFTLNLPLTLLITTALFMRAGTERYAIALSSIREVTLSAESALLRKENRTLLQVGEELIELKSIRHILHREPNRVEGAMPVVIVRTSQGLVGLVVDELLGRQEIVIKTLGSLKPIERSCFGGATIDSEGRVVLVIDPMRLGAGKSVHIPERHAFAETAPPAGGVHVAEQQMEAKAVILLIDDSLSIRKFVGKMLESAGYLVDTAVDGEDGMRKASEADYHLIITDLEMPKYNGYEVVQALRGRPETKQTPIVVMTTRAGDKHRRLALDIEANGYIAKPVDERTLLQEVERWVGTTASTRK